MRRPSGQEAGTAQQTRQLAHADCPSPLLFHWFGTYKWELELKHPSLYPRRTAQQVQWKGKVFMWSIGGAVVVQLPYLVANLCIPVRCKEMLQVDHGFSHSKNLYVPLSYCCYHPNSSQRAKLPAVCSLRIPAFLFCGWFRLIIITG